MSSVNPLYLIINKIDQYIDGSNGNKSLTLVSADTNKDIIKRYTELWNKIEGLIRLVTNIWGNYDEKDRKIKFNSDDNSLLNKILRLHNFTILGR